MTRGTVTPRVSKSGALVRPIDAIGGTTKPTTLDETGSRHPWLTSGIIGIRQFIAAQRDLTFGESGCLTLGINQLFKCGWLA